MTKNVLFDQIHIDPEEKDMSKVIALLNENFSRINTATDGSYAEGTHDHSDASTGGALGNDSITNAMLDSTTTGELAGGWSTWTPTIGVVGGTYGSVTTNRAVYKKIGNIVFLEIDVTGTAGSTPSYYTFTPPTTPATNTLGCMTVQRIFDTASNYVMGICFRATTTFRVYKYDRSTFTDGAGSRFQVSGWYEEA